MPEADSLSRIGATGGARYGMAADQGVAAARHRARRRRRPSRAPTSSGARCRPIPERESCRAFRPRCASGATPMACRTSSPRRWTTRRGRSATCTRASGSSRWRCSAASDRGGMAEFAGADLRERRQVHADARLLSRGRERASQRCRPWAQKRLAGLCRRGQRLPRQPRGARCRPSSSSAGAVPSPGSPRIRWSGASCCRSSSPTTTSSRRCARILRQKLGPEQAAWMFPGDEARRSDHDRARAQRARTQAAKASRIRSAP